MPWVQEINFRNTSGFRTGDSADAYIQTAISINYPTTTSQGNDVGWENGTMEASENNHNDASGVDVRLAGMHFRDASRDYRIDLPNTGTFKFRLGMVDHAYAGVAHKCEIFDTSTSRGVLCDDASAAQHNVIDAQGSELSEANWPSSNAWSDDMTFTSTICRVRFPNTAYWAIAHITVEEVSTDIPHKAYLYNKAVHRASYW